MLIVLAFTSLCLFLFFFVMQILLSHTYTILYQPPMWCGCCIHPRVPALWQRAGSISGADSAATTIDIRHHDAIHVYLFVCYHLWQVLASPWWSSRAWSVSTTTWSSPTRSTTSSRRWRQRFRGKTASMTGRRNTAASTAKPRVVSYMLNHNLLSTLRAKLTPLQ